MTRLVYNVNVTDESDAWIRAEVARLGAANPGVEYYSCGTSSGVEIHGCVQMTAEQIEEHLRGEWPEESGGVLRGWVQAHFNADGSVKGGVL